MKKITDKHFSFKCPMDFTAMAPSANGVFCSKCSKEVFDLTDCSIDDVIALQRKHGRICGSIRIMPLAATAVALSAAACSSPGSLGSAPVSCPAEPTGNYSVDADGHRNYEGVSGGEVCDAFELIKSQQ
ncbi:hypothetical protein [Luteolibacter soli]|uniref:Uncharacterized protein n=1 Tax=Luteolibacter soli TaxID=3135280 RepID=A0ABU9APH6_9BACT